MNENRNQRIQELFVAALDLPAADREAWLRLKCGDDQAILDEVLDLLRHDQPTADPLERGLDRDLLGDAGLYQRPDQSGLHVRCPHCHHPIELVDDAELSDVVCGSCGSSFSLIAADETRSYSTDKPTRIAHFELIERVGVGAFGSVFKARDTKLDRIVAVKVPRKGQLSGDEAEKFLREARTAAQLNHPNIVAVHEVGREEDRVFIVSDFVDGVTLSDWLTGMQPTPQETAELCITIARALQYAHEQGVIHRDLKPGNIMLDRNSQPFLMDFGLAKREAAEITMTMEGQVLGTPAYMSPEQARGDAHSVDGTTDIYAMGVILFEMLTGERPFRGNLRMLLHQVLTEEAPSPRKYNASIPKDLETICLNCLEKTPARRYDTADDLAEDLERFIEHKPIDARPITSFERSWRWCKRKPVVAGLAASLFLAMAIGTVVSSYFAVDANRKANDLAVANLQTNQSTVKALINLGDLESQRGQWRNALLAFDDAITRSQGSVDQELLFRRILALHILGESGTARQEIDALLNGNKGRHQTGRLLLLAGDVLSTEQGNIQAALSFYEQAFQTGGVTDAESHFLQAVLSDTLEDALSHVERAVALEPLYVSANQLHLLLLILNGQMDRVDQRIAELRRLSPHDPSFTILEACILTMADDRQLAIENVKSLSSQMSDKQVDKILVDLQQIAEYHEQLENVIATFADWSQYRVADNWETEMTLPQQDNLNSGLNSLTRWFSVSYVESLRKTIPTVRQKIAAKRFDSARDDLAPLLSQFRIHELYLVHAQLCDAIGHINEPGLDVEQLLIAEKSYQTAMRIPPLFRTIPPLAALGGLNIQQKLVFFETVDDEQAEILSQNARPNLERLINVMREPSHHWHDWIMDRAWMVAVGAVAVKDFDSTYIATRLWFKHRPESYDYALAAKIYRNAEFLQLAIRNATEALKRDPQSQARLTREKAVGQLKKLIEANSD